jgi:hypothetical protein
LSAYGKLWCRPNQTKFVEQFVEYSPTFGGHDDVLDAIAMGVTWSERQSVGDWIDGDAVEVDDDEFPVLDFRNAP